MPCVPTKLVFWMAWGQCKSLQCATDIFYNACSQCDNSGHYLGFHYICSERTVKVQVILLHKQLGRVAAENEVKLN